MGVTRRQWIDLVHDAVTVSDVELALLGGYTGIEYVSLE
jgi:hypothetical protein